MTLRKPHPPGPYTTTATRWFSVVAVALSGVAPSERLAHISPPHPEEQSQVASRRRIQRSLETPSCFETPASRAPQHEGCGGCADRRICSASYPPTSS